MGRECGCRCHAGHMGDLCCPECEPDAYVECKRCGEPRHAHDEEEGRSTGACATFTQDPTP